MQSTAFARLFYRSTARPAACRRAIDLSRSPLPDTLVAVMRAVDPAVGDAAFACKMKRTPRPREHARLISTDGGAGLPLAGWGIGWGGAGCGSLRPPRGGGGGIGGVRAFCGVPNVAVPARAVTLEGFVALGGRVVPGAGAGRLARASAGGVAFLRGRRGGRCSRCGRRPGRGSPPRWCWRVAAPHCLRSRMGRWQRMCMA